MLSRYVITKLCDSIIILGHVSIQNGTNMNTVKCNLESAGPSKILIIIGLSETDNHVGLQVSKYILVTYYIYIYKDL